LKDLKEKNQHHHNKKKGGIIKIIEALRGGNSPTRSDGKASNRGIACRTSSRGKGLQKGRTMQN